MLLENSRAVPRWLACVSRTSLATTVNRVPYCQPRSRGLTGHSGGFQNTLSHASPCVCYKDKGSKSGSTAKGASRRSKHQDTHEHLTHHRRSKRHRSADRQAHTHTPAHTRTDPHTHKPKPTHAHAQTPTADTQHHNHQHHNARRRTTGPNPTHCCLRPPIMAARLPGAALAPRPTPTPPSHSIPRQPGTPPRSLAGPRRTAPRTMHRPSRLRSPRTCQRRHPAHPSDPA